MSRGLEVIFWNTDWVSDGETAIFGNWTLVAKQRSWSISDGKNSCSGPARGIVEAKARAVENYERKRKEWR